MAYNGTCKHKQTAKMFRKNNNKLNIPILNLSGRNLSLHDLCCARETSRFLQSQRQCQLYLADNPHLFATSEGIAILNDLIQKNNLHTLHIGIVKTIFQ